MKAIFKREFKSYFTSPIGYVVVTILILYSAMIFSSIFQGGSPDISGVFGSMFSIVLFIIPLLTMRSFSEEKKQKTDQLLLTSPTRLSGIVMGKFFAAFSVFALGLSPTLIFQLIIASYIAPNWLIYFGNLIGMLILSSALIALGIYISALTESQIVAAIGSFAIALMLMLLDVVASLINLEFITKASEWFSFSARYSTFTVGTLDYSNIIFFISLAVIFIFLTVKALDKKRWA